MNKTLAKIFRMEPEKEPLVNRKALPPTPRTQIHVSLQEMETMARAIAKSGMFGVRDEAQALSLMLLCQAEGLHPVLALRRYHIIEGKPSMRADALQGEFEQAGAILWHERTETECSATFFRDKRQVNDASFQRAKLRYSLTKSGAATSSVAAIGKMTIVSLLWRISPTDSLSARTAKLQPKSCTPITQREINKFTGAVNV